MSRFLSELRRLSFRRSFLWAACLCIVGLGCALGSFLASSRVTPDAFAGELVRELTDQVKDPPRLSQLLAVAGWVQVRSTESMPEGDLTGMHPDVQRLIEVLRGGSEEDARRVFEAQGSDGCLPLAILEAFHARYAAAARLIEDAEHERVRRYAASLVMQAGDAEWVKRLVQNPAYDEVLEDGSLYVFFGEHGYWREMVHYSIRSGYEGISFSVVLLAVVVALVWGSILLAQRQAASRKRFVGLMIPCFLLGALSTWPTVWSAWVLDPLLGLEQRGEFVPDLLFFCLSVGLREEGWKLLFFLPMLLLVRGRGREVDVIVLAATVGLGFAVAENVLYFERALLGGGVGVGRLMTANLLHISATAICGLFAYRFFQAPGRNAGEFASALFSVAGVHGLYDTLISAPVPGLGDLGYFSGTVLTLLAWFFLQELGKYAPLQGRTVSLTSIYLIGLALVFSVELVAVCLRLPFYDALYRCGSGALSTILFVFVFLRQVREPLTD